MSDPHTQWPRPLYVDFKEYVLYMNIHPLLNYICCFISMFFDIYHFFC